MYSVALLAAAAYLPSISAKPFQTRQSNVSMAYGFGRILAKADFDWVPCFDQFTCTKLLVPLDYEDESAGTTHVSFIKWTSNSTTTNTTQDILLNPGGPGGSGITFLPEFLDRLLAWVGTDYNLVSFDPRGVNNSGPSLSCIPGGAKGTSRLYNDLEVPVDVETPRSYGEAYQRAAAFGDFCSAAHAENSTAKYANTVATATDMLHYTKLLAKSKGQDPKKSQLWYYGVSYGTILGTTFATLFPDRVGRVIVDGVVDGEDYYQGKWLSNVVDADEAVRYFFQTCHKAGRDKCAFWAESPAAIEAKYHAIVDEMRYNPIPVSTLIYTPNIVTIEDLKRVVLQVPYDPIRIFPTFAEVLSGLEKRNGTLLALAAGVGVSLNACDINPALYADREPLVFISCLDANGRYNVSTLDAFKDRVHTLYNTSEYLGEAWASATGTGCHKFDIRAPSSQVLKDYPGANKTSNPLFFSSTRFDPVTPLRAARKMAGRFPGAGLLLQEGVGHGVISAPSVCTSQYFRQYLSDAKLPEGGTVCQPDLVPFNETAPAGSASLRRRHLIGV